MSLSWFRLGDPGPCPICDAPHTTCCTPHTSGSITVPLLPARKSDETAAPSTTGGRAAETETPSQTTATYRSSTRRHRP
jgi:hypothetical protein